MRVLVLGASGMAGHVIALFLKEQGYSVDTLSGHTRLDSQTILIDVRNGGRLKKVLAATDYDVVVNCIGLLVKESEEDQAKATYINAFLPKFLENYYKDSKTKVIHISTNGVFSGKNRPYREDSPHDAENFYGRSKALGEINNNKDLTIRTSIIGPELTKNGKSLFHWFWRQSGEVSGFTSSKWSGITTIELAKMVQKAIEQNISGIYHLVPEAQISKYDLLQMFARIFNKPTTVKPVSGNRQDMSIVTTRTDFTIPLPSYETMLEQMKEWMKGHKELYEHYEI